MPTIDDVVCLKRPPQRRFLVQHDKHVRDEEEGTSIDPQRNRLVEQRGACEGESGTGGVR